MAKTITLKFPGTCADCGAQLPVGARAKWYGRGRVYGLGCHERTGGERSSGKQVWFGGVRIPATRAPGGVCEDAPCCGCCGPGSDDPAYQPYEPEEREDYR